MYRCDKATGAKASPAFLWPELGAIDPKLPKKERLKRLADLVTHPDNGRFPRTIVNRIWQRLFGRGIVHPVDMMANQPWSEDLLDYLAGYLVEQKYDLKQLLAHICTSDAYAAQTSIWDKEPSGDDYVFRGPQVRRMTAEEFVDAIRQITHDKGAQQGRLQFEACAGTRRSGGTPFHAGVASRTQNPDDALARPAQSRTGRHDPA